MRLKTEETKAEQGQVCCLQSPCWVANPGLLALSLASFSYLRVAAFVFLSTKAALKWSGNKSLALPRDQAQPSSPLPAPGHSIDSQITTAWCKVAFGWLGDFANGSGTSLAVRKCSSDGKFDFLQSKHETVQTASFHSGADLPCLWWIIYLFGVHQMSGTILGSGPITVNKATRCLFSWRSYSPEGRCL